MMLQMTNPSALWLLLLAIPIVYLSIVNLRTTERVRRWTILVVRLVLLIIIVALMCDLKRVARTDRLTVIGLIDTSGSVRQLSNLPIDPDKGIRDHLDYLRQWFRKATEERQPDDRVGLIIFDGKPIALATPTAGNYNDGGIDRKGSEGTNIAQALRYALAMFPPDTAKRLVLLTDGNETAGDTMTAIAEATGSGGGMGDGGGVSIDLVPIEYQVKHEVTVERIEVPPFSRPGERVKVRIVIRSTGNAAGRLYLKREGRAIDLNGPENKGTSRLVELQDGLQVVTTEVTLGEETVSRFVASFEPSGTQDDTMLSNNSASALSITAQRGSVLIADGVYDGRGHYLSDVLKNAGFSVKRVPSDGLPGSLMELQSYDIVILQNVPAEDVSKSTQEHLVRYVNDLGGGLIMVGGYDSFGAGHWEDTPVAGLLPVSLKVPEELRIPRAAIALVLDRSGSMNYAVEGTRRTKQEIANEGAALAIESLDKNDFIAVYAFATFTQTIVPMQKVKNPKIIADKIRSITAGGGTSILPAMERAFKALQKVDAEIKHVVCLSDGQSQGEGFGKLAAKMKKAGITVSAIAVGNDADEVTMEDIANQGGGRYYFVRNPEILPRIFVKEIRVIRRPLIREVDFHPVIRDKSSPITAAMGSRPPLLHGLVLTQALKGDATVHFLMQTPEGEPILTYKQEGLGRTAAFTSDAHDNWAKDWLGLPVYQNMWLALARTIMRPPGNRDYELRTSIKGDRLQLQILDENANRRRNGKENSQNQNGNRPGNDSKDNAKNNENDYRLPLVIPGFVYTPDGRSMAVRLRQTGPNVYSASVPALTGGQYVVALTPRRGRENIGLILGGINRPAGVEYRRMASNTNRLRSAVKAAGGRILDVSDPQAVNLFDHDSIPEKLSMTPMWPVLVWWVIALFLIDVAARRFAWDGEIIRERIHRTLMRVRLTPQRSAQTAATLEQLRNKGLTIGTGITSGKSGESSDEHPAVMNGQDDSQTIGDSTLTGNARKEDIVTFTDERNTIDDENMEPSDDNNEQEREAARRKAIAALTGRSANKSSSDNRSADLDTDEQRQDETIGDSESSEDVGAISRLAAKRRGSKDKTDSTS